MKKHFVLFILFCLFFMGCTTIGEKFTQIGRHLWRLETEPEELQKDLEKIMRDYHLTLPVKVIVVDSNELQAEKSVKEVLEGFGFELYVDEYKGPVDYEIKVEKQDVGKESSRSGYYYSQTGKEKVVVEIKLIISDGRIEHYFIGIGSYSYSRFYRGDYYQRDSIQDPSALATKIAAAKAVAKFIDEQNIPHRIPEKK